MAEFFRKSVLAGIGLITQGSKDMKKLVDDLIKKGEISSRDGEKLLKELLKKGEEARKEFTEKLHKGAEGVLSSADIATKEDIEALSKRVASLEKKIKDTKKTK